MTKTKMPKLDSEPIIPNRYTKLCMSCPAWFVCKDGEGLPHQCIECDKPFFLCTKLRKNAFHSVYGHMDTEEWRFIEGIPAECPFLTDEFIRYAQPCPSCMKEAGIKVIE